jgi:hypothetical protein
MGAEYEQELEERKARVIQRAPLAATTTASPARTRRTRCVCSASSRRHSRAASTRTASART